MPAKATLVKSTYGSTEKQEGGQWWFLCVDRGCRFAGDSFPVIIIGALYSLFKIDPYHMKPIDPKGYTIREAEFIHGRRPLYEADSHVIYPIYRKATAYGDDAILHIIDCRYTELKTEHERVARENSKKHRCKRKERVALYGCDNYTERQLQIINGYIPYDDITGIYCKAIRDIAKKRQDTEVLEIVGRLSDRIRSDYKKRHKAIRSEILRNNSKFLPDDLRVHDFFTTWERQILSRYSDTSKINSKTLSKLLYRATFIIW